MILLVAAQLPFHSLLASTGLQGPFCKVNTTTTRCPAGETLSMSNGKSKFLVVPCLPQRVRTLAGCLCSNYWTERNDIDLSQSHSWPILPTAQMQDGLHQGWLLAGNCSRALDLPGGPPRVADDVVPAGGRHTVRHACTCTCKWRMKSQNGRVTVQLR